MCMKMWICTTNQRFLSISQTLCFICLVATFLQTFRVVVTSGHVLQLVANFSNSFQHHMNRQIAATVREIHCGWLPWLHRAFIIGSDLDSAMDRPSVLSNRLTSGILSGHRNLQFLYHFSWIDIPHIYVCFFMSYPKYPLSTDPINNNS